MRLFVFIGIVLGAIALSIWRQISRAKMSLDSVVKAYNIGDYQTALQNTESLRVGSTKTAEYCFMRGAMLHQLGWLEEAETSLREGLPMQRDPRSRSLVLNTLGQVLMDQGRFAEAVKTFDYAIGAWTDRGAPHSEIAQAWLHQGIELPAALNRARVALEIDRASRAPNKIHNSRIAEAGSILAWAVAVVAGDAAEVESLLTEAIPLGADQSKSVQAHIHYYAGLAYSALKEKEKSVKNFRAAVEVDPYGRYGRFARIELERV